MIFQDYSVTLRLSLAGFTAERFGLSSVFYLPRLDAGLPVFSYRVAHHYDGHQQAGAAVDGWRGWQDVFTICPLEKVVF